MESKLIQTYEIPSHVRKQYAKFTSLELYTDKLIGKGSNDGDITWFFRNYMGIEWTPANLGTQFAQLIFVTLGNANDIISVNNLRTATDVNRIMFCSGMFKYEPANVYVKSLYLEIKEVFDEYQAKQSATATSGTPVQASGSQADELLKFKELLDGGIITQEEFDVKKKQLLGL